VNTDNIHRHIYVRIYLQTNLRTYIFTYVDNILHVNTDNIHRHIYVRIYVYTYTKKTKAVGSCVCCSVVQCVLQCAFQCGAVCCSVLQYFAGCSKALGSSVTRHKLMCDMPHSYVRHDSTYNAARYGFEQHAITQIMRVCDFFFFLHESFRHVTLLICTYGMTHSYV